MANQPIDFVDTSEKIDRLGLKPRGVLGGHLSGGVYYTVGKRILDLFLVVATVPFWLPVIAILAAIVARDGGKPFYKQNRVGTGARTFTMWKLRTMVVNADERLEAHLEQNSEARAEWNSTQKLRNDPRVTLFGLILRKTSMDELPQLWNVLKGDMSLVGPRPMMLEQRVLYPGLAYYRLRPGITGNWQITDRNKSTFAARAEFDRDYAANLTMGGDLKILFHTVGVVLKGTGC